VGIGERYFSVQRSVEKLFGCKFDDVILDSGIVALISSGKSERKM
jgi:hypothetical protein